MTSSSRITISRHPFILLLCLIFAWNFVALAQTDTAAGKGGEENKWTDEKLSMIEENLVADLESPNIGVSIGGAQTVREMKQHVPDYDYSKIIIPLMRIVKNEDADRAARILAALALHDLNSERGNFAISREGEMSKDEIFRSFCANLARTREAEKKK